MNIRRNPRVNEKIKASQVRVIDENKINLGVLSTYEAIKIAKEKNLDLVEVVSNANPPVCYIIDYGKFKYEQQQKEKERKRTQQTRGLKEIRFSYKIDEHDYQTKMTKIREFLANKQRVKIVLFMRGRETLHKDLGMKQLERLLQDLSDVAYTEGQPKFLGQSGNAIQLILLPLKKS